jgi:hypothetical protein
MQQNREKPFWQRCQAVWCGDSWVMHLGEGLSLILLDEYSNFHVRSPHSLISSDND